MSELPAAIDGIPLHESITVERVVEAAERYDRTLDYPGFCIACGADQDGCEPDAQRYLCEACDEPAVYGASELVIHLAI